MHEACNYVLDQMIDSRVWCDCMTFGTIFGLSVGALIGWIGSGIIQLLDILIERSKSKKKPDSQA